MKYIFYTALLLGTLGIACNVSADPKDYYWQCYNNDQYPPPRPTWSVVCEGPSKVCFFVIAPWREYATLAYCEDKKKEGVF